MMSNMVTSTNVPVSALHSRRGASFKLLSVINADTCGIHVSVPLVVEYEDARQTGVDLPLDRADLDAILDYLQSRWSEPSSSSHPIKPINHRSTSHK